MFTVTLAPRESTLSISLSNIYMTIKTFSRNITSSTNLAHRENTNPQVPIRLSFEGFSSSLGKEKSTKCTYFASGHCFIHPPLIFPIQGLIMSLKHAKLCINLLSQSLWTLYYLMLWKTLYQYWVILRR